jgi:DNA-binding transcriptional regulator YiaG
LYHNVAVLHCGIEGFAVKMAEKKCEEYEGGGDDGNVCDQGPLRMSSAEFSRLRALLGKSQRELAELLGLSLKAVESYEQGWRKVPAHVEKVLYFLLLKIEGKGVEGGAACWEIQDCPPTRRSSCVAYLAGEGRFCWFFTGRLCARSKAGGCASCRVFSRMRQSLESVPGDADPVASDPGAGI